MDTGKKYPLKFSVIICTRNRADALPNCLNSVVAALTQVPDPSAEIIVVDNGSTDNTFSVVTRYSETCPVPVIVVQEPQKGLARARNTGVLASQGELLIFTDDDCCLAEDYFVAAIRHYDADTELVMRGGRVELGDPTDLRITYKTDDTKQSWSKKTHPHDIGMLDTAIIGANMMLHRALFDKIGEFDVRLGAGTEFPGGEETDYIYRIYSSGQTIEYVPDMMVHHFHGRKTADEGKKLLAGYTKGLGALYAKNMLKDIRWLRPIYWSIRNTILYPESGEAITSNLKFTNVERANNLVAGILGFSLHVLKSYCRSFLIAMWRHITIKKICDLSWKRILK